MDTPAGDRGAPAVSERPSMPEGYGVPASSEGLLAWEAVDARIRDSTVYWVATTRPDGRPHVVPRWGVWLDGRLYYDGSPTTVHAVNLRSNPHCVVHLEDGTRAAILEGTSGASSPPGPALGGRIAAEMARKYGEQGYSPEPDAWEGGDAGGLCVFVPEKGLAWHDFPKDVTRYRFGGD